MALVPYSYRSSRIHLSQYGLAEYVLRGLQAGLTLPGRADLIQQWLAAYWITRRTPPTARGFTRERPSIGDHDILLYFTVSLPRFPTASHLLNGTILFHFKVSCTGSAPRTVPRLVLHGFAFYDL